MWAKLFGLGEFHPSADAQKLDKFSLLFIRVREARLARAPSEPLHIFDSALCVF